MMIQFNKGLMIGLSALFCVSCVTPPISQPQPTTQPTITPDKDEKPQTQPLPTISVPSTPSTTEPKPPVRPTAPVPEPAYPVKPSVLPTEPVSPPEPISPPSTPETKPKPPPSPSPALRVPASLVSLRKTTAVPGGVAWVPLGIESAIPPKIKYKQRRVLVLHHEQQWVALVGIPLSAKTGRHTVVNQETGKRYTFKVKAKKYKAQHIKLKNKRHVNPTSKDLKRIQSERKLMKAAFASPWQITSTSPLPLMQPVRGRLSSPFGLRRYFNGQPRNPHTGLDIAVPQGTPIAAAASGRVLKTGHYFYTGKTVMIDHGQKVVTLYGHLNTIAVSAGQRVKRGQKIGTVGKTGRATGPHLHWSVSLNQTLIDPKLIMQ